MGAHITELGENRKKLTKLLFINAWEILAHFTLQVGRKEEIHLRKRSKG